MNNTLKARRIIFRTAEKRALSERGAYAFAFSTERSRDPFYCHLQGPELETRGSSDISTVGNMWFQKVV